MLMTWWLENQSFFFVERRRKLSTCCGYCLVVAIELVLVLGAE